MRRRIDQEKTRVFDGFDEVLRRRARHGAGGVPEPPVLGSELDDVLFAFAIDHVAAQAPRRDERGIPRHFARALEEFPYEQRLRDEERLHEDELFLCERRSSLKVRS